MGWILIYDQDTGELEYLGVPTQRTLIRRVRRWIRFLPGNVKRRYCRWANGGVLSRWTPPPFVGWSCPKWAPKPIRRLSWWLYGKWLDRTDRIWHQELRRRFWEVEGIAVH